MELSIDDFAFIFKGSGILLGLDLGTKTIGLAISDARQQFASPLMTLQRIKFTQDVAELKKIIQKNDVSGLVLGLPINMDDSEGRRAQSTRSFARNMLKDIALPLMFCDERLSSFEAKQTMADAGLSPARRREKVDAYAAAVILNDALKNMHKLFPFAHPRGEKTYP